jgi:hypothetical protein
MRELYDISKRVISSWYRLLTTQLHNYTTHNTQQTQESKSPHNPSNKTAAELGLYRVVTGVVYEPL